MEALAATLARLVVAENEAGGEHPNASIYRALDRIVGPSGYYLESEPCLICNKVCSRNLIPGIRIPSSVSVYSRAPIRWPRALSRAKVGEASFLTLLSG